MSTEYGGYMGKVLKINLSTREVNEYPWTDRERELFIGGKIMAAKILYDNLSPDVEPFSAENILAVTTGPLSGTGAPMASRFNISTISPLTGYVASSNCGGDFGISLKKAGYDALVVTGKAEIRTWLEIVDDQITFHDAEELWGKTTAETQAVLGPKTGKMVIGPAGENLVKYAGVFSQERTAGRAGVGAVMGSKNLKAIVASGSHKILAYNPDKAKQLYGDWAKTLVKHPLSGVQLKKFGTAGLVSIMQYRKVLATRNFKYGQYKDFDKISGELLAEKHLVSNKGCVTCPIQCGRQVEVRGKKVKGPELETLGLLGANLENPDLESILEWNLLLDELGMDTISAAGSVAFAMELNENGHWDNGLEFGKTERLAQVFEDIAYRRGIGAELAEGVKCLSEKYGGADYAMHSKGLELSAYEPRSAVGLGLGYAVSNRGACHLNAGYSILFEGLGLAMDPYTAASKAELNIILQDLMEAASAVGTCLFSLYAVIPAGLIAKPNSGATRFVNKVLPRTGGTIAMINKAPEKAIPVNLPLLPHTAALKYATGLKMNFGRFRRIGERGFNLERLINVRRGLTAAEDSLPKRLTRDLQDLEDSRTKVPLEQLKKKYYSSRGWDENGVPKSKTLRKLGLTGG